MRLIELTEQRAKTLREIRVGKRMSLTEAVKGTGVHQKTVERWEDRKVKRIREETLVLVLKNYGLKLDEFLAMSDEKHVLKSAWFPKDSQLTTLPDFLSASEQVDKTVLSVLNSMSQLTDSAESAFFHRGEVYRDLLYGGLLRRGFHLVRFCEALLKTNAKECEPRVRIKLDEDFNNLSISDGNISLQVADQRLLWPCSCLPESSQTLIRKLGHCGGPCPIHSHPEGERLMDLTSREFVELQHLGGSIIWRQSRQMWPPSVDSVLMLRNLRYARALDVGMESLLDLGCGTGILGIALSSRFPSVRRVSLADWLLTPLAFAVVNARQNLSRSGISWNIHLGMFVDWIDSHPTELYDVLVSTPPYLPASDGHEPVFRESPVAGIDLLEFVIRHGRRLAKRSFVTFSNIVQEETQRFANEAGVRLLRIGKAVNVPFRVPIALRNPRYISSLIESGRLKFVRNNLYPLQHRIATFEIIHDGR